MSRRCSSNRLRMRKKMSARCESETSRHAPAASRAAATALSTSSTDANATSPVWRPLAGLKTGPPGLLGTNAGAPDLMFTQAATCTNSGCTPQDPLYDYAQTGHMAASDGCPPLDGATRAGASISGLAFATSASYPAPYRNGLFVADYSRNCIVVLPDAGSGVPSATAIPFEHDAVTPVNLTTDPNGNIVYGDFGTGTVHRIRYAAPTASFTATPSNGTAPRAQQRAARRERAARRSFR